MSAYVQQASVLSGRSVAFMAVVGLHALIISALIAMKIVPPLMDLGPRPIEIVNVPPDVTPPPPPPALKPMKLQPFQAVVPLLPPPEITPPADALLVEMSPAPAVDTGPVAVDTGAGAGPVITAPPARVGTDLQYRAVKSPDEFYPSTSVTLQEQGIAIVQVCVGADGRIDGVPTIQTSSGYKRLDQAAIKWTREALRFTPATENGAGVRACKGFRVVFNLN